MSFTDFDDSDTSKPLFSIVELGSGLAQAPTLKVHPAGARLVLVVLLLALACVVL